MSLYILSFLYIVMAKSGSSTVMYNLETNMIFQNMNSEPKNSAPSSNIKCKRCRNLQFLMFTFQLLYIFLDSPSFEPVLCRAQRHLLVSCMLPPTRDKQIIGQS